MYCHAFISAIIITFLAFPVASETVFICDGEGEGGSVLFSDKPCRNGQGQSLHFPDVYTSGEGLSELERQQLEEIEAKEKEQQERQTIKLSPSEAIPMEDPPARTASSETVDKDACRKAEESVRAWGRIMSLGYLPEQEATMRAEYENRKSKMEAACDK